MTKKLIILVILLFVGIPAFAQIPHVVSTSPTKNELNVPVQTNILVTFDVDMDETTINNSSFTVNASSTGLHQGNITYNSGTRTATFDPLIDFFPGEVVTVTLTTEIQSSEGAPLDGPYVWSFTTEVANSHGTFAPAVNYVPGDGPCYVFSADLDDDGDLDLAVANWYSDNVSILKNNGDGTFHGAVNYGVGDAPGSVFCADLDGDGDLDLAVANYYSDNVSILKNNGDGTFQAAVNYGAGDGPYTVFCADLDGDNDMDLAVANWYSDNVSILKNNGDGTFQTAVNYGVGDVPCFVFCGDLDGDGDLDLAVANYYSNNVSILKNNGDGTFQGAANYGVGDAPCFVLCADLDKDGDLDLAVANFSSDNVSILLNQSANTNFYFVHISDPHVGAPGADKRFQLVIDSINALTPPPEFVVISGDLVSRGGHNPYWEKFDSLLDSLRPPVYVCVGNHDYRSFLWPVDPQYQHYFGDYDECPTINLYLISMNSGGNASWWDCDVRVIDWFPEGLGISASQMSWLTDIMDDHPGYNKILFMHHPIVCTDPNWLCEGEEESNGCITNNRNELMNLCRNEDVKVVLSGHTHKPYQYTVDNANHPVTLSDNLAPNGYWSSYTVPDLPMYIITGACSQYLEYRKIEVQGEEVRVYKEGKFNGRYDLAEYETDYLSLLPWKEGQRWSKADSILAPGRLHVYDSFGNHVGVNDIGGIDFQIPGAYYEDETAPIDSSDTSLLCTNGEIISLMLDPTQSYSYKIETFLPCTLNVTGNFVKKNGEGEVSTSYLGIPFTSGSVGKLFITNESIDYTLYIDDDGDSTVDREILPDTIITTFRGDANGDGVIDISDVVYLINYLFIHGPAPVPLAAGDATCDAVVDASDVVYLINYLFVGGPPPGC